MHQNTLAGISIYSDALADKICTRLMNGESLARICSKESREQDPELPSIPTVYNWLKDQSDKYKYFREAYIWAREQQADTLADEILTIADEPHYTHEEIAQAKLRIDSRKWLASKLRPKKWGPSILKEQSTDSSGHDEFVKSFTVVVGE